MARDNFTKETVTSLGKRVGFLCSNPSCGKHTAGPHTDPDKVTIIGEAAHIEAASAGGPRYNATMTLSERKSIINGIWLCSNCSDLIDKDPKAYSVKLLRDWKGSAEKKMLDNLVGNQVKDKSVENPYLEADLIWTDGLRAPRGYSDKNPISEVDGKMVRVIGSKPIMHWEIRWHYNLTIHNNSSYPAFNLNIESVGDAHFDQIDKINKVNNIPPFSSLDIKAVLIHRIEDDHTVADKIMSRLIPDIADGIILNLNYSDEDRNEHQTEVKIFNNELLNNKIR